MSRIHPQAIVDPAARLADDVEVGPWTLIGPDVEIGAGTVIGPHVVVRGPTTIGQGNRIFQFASVGEDCQDKKYHGEPTRLVIGDNNVIREGCTLHRGTVQDRGVTTIGSNNLLMAYVHIAHDCIVGDNIIMANNATIAGHVHVGDGVILGGYTTVHQFCHIGAWSMSAANSAVFKDIPAFVMVGGNPASAHGMNFEGMRRRGYSQELIAALRRAYKVVYRQGKTLQEALQLLDDEASQYPEVALYRDSILASTRGITR
ncbi:acyl-ACP--UDP-N-acetylglucosamine O-acyltransferase [Pseudomonas sp. G11-1]|uniref:Acyl-[acyl-carrier-protein]--UDP-N-acetylglucosamine O-acyltransferase n=1 Tax=Halopseudomonas bauzanensis TaxID=653930 RepID=A0A031MG44_9GAMM|nr:MULTISPECIES: acyl-ACP--UDP-N-acetylglucosamine O-acyltransferase [Halopseudomonas]MCO5786688.1 acyl-ACP--UDP-N-acetylglucosamine O-acyltransferase [Pseudomonas sp. G11-1]MCO5789914.1 acyl-ACP--UDP-N-acetylglucosamine O-acyltransferase [Pseudomonas sp. G11-2]EZQ18744.1 UDP-N-acetylglucosamine acyltransferase [Halopseudomonas bauzanensis]TKA92178.1 acyl-ACP--UDP-N-acetylglucosamine O-acyltransferase [Halopseudomonas bauzanensis]WGK62423.1 acyl-ACP--UDP-N-acetylglucosamine O-acyltransferase [